MVRRCKTFLFDSPMCKDKRSLPHRQATRCSHLSPCGGETRRSGCRNRRRPAGLAAPRRRQWTPRRSHIQNTPLEPWGNQYLKLFLECTLATVALICDTLRHFIFVKQINSVPGFELRSAPLKLVITVPETRQSRQKDVELRVRSADDDVHRAHVTKNHRREALHVGQSEVLDAARSHRRNKH